MHAERTRRSFRPSLAATLLLGGLALCFYALGQWQLGRAEEKDLIQQQHDRAPSFDTLPAAGNAPRYARVRLSGRFDTQRHVLVDNQVFQGRAGVHVLTPFQLDDGRWLLVNRGWLPLPADRRSLPDVPTPDGGQKLSGKLDEMYRPGKRLGRDDPLQGDWPRLVTYPETDAIAKALDHALYPLVLLLDAQHTAGFGDRDWKPVNNSAAKHRARAMQWFTFIAAALIIWIFLGIRRGKET